MISSSDDEQDQGKVPTVEPQVVQRESESSPLKPEPPLRRSRRDNKGKHSNPFKEPRSAIQSEIQEIITGPQVNFAQAVAQLGSSLGDLLLQYYK